MIKNILTDSTSVFSIESDKLIQYDESLDNEFIEIAKKISSETGIPEKRIYCGEHGFRIANWHKIAGEYYYFKETCIEFIINELLGEVISEYFGLDTVHYNIAKLSIPGEDDKYGVVSKNMCKVGTKYEEFDIRKCGCFFEQDLRIIDRIRVLCDSEDEFIRLQNDIKTLIIRSFFSGEGDRDPRNFFLEITNLGRRLSFLFDYTSSYIDYNRLGRWITEFAELNVTDKNTQELLRNDAKFQELLNLLMESDMDCFIEKVEDVHKIIIPSQDKARYKRHDSKVKSLVKENKLIR